MNATRPSRRPLAGRVVTLCLVLAGAAVAARRPVPVAFAADGVGGGLSYSSTSPRAAFRALAWHSADELDRLFEIDSLRGRSGKLRAVLVPRSARRVGVLERLFGDSLLGTPGVHDVRDSSGSRRFALITMRDFAEKLGDRIGDYRMGFWPAEQGKTLASESYANPEGFIEVTPENMDTHVSEHFRLRDFLTHDQQDVWPKYLVLRAPLVDKLELVIAQLETRGTRVKHMSVMSGFRTPQYNENGGETGGRASMSRHMFGDAADVFVDNNGDGRMDDLNHDGRVNYRDAQVILRAVERVEREHEDLVGGVGVYRATRSHGPFAHVDVRGRRARWGRL